jgi:hypothetical protein
MIAYSIKAIKGATVTSADPCTGARKHGTALAQTPHGASITANSTGHASHPGGRNHRGLLVAPGEPARSWKLTPLGRRPQQRIQEPHTKGTGGHTPSSIWAFVGCREAKQESSKSRNWTIAFIYAWLPSPTHNRRHSRGWHCALPQELLIRLSLRTSVGITWFSIETHHREC